MLSGSLMLGLLAITFWDETNRYFQDKQTPHVIFQAGFFVLAAWITGTFFDAVRNGIIEEWSKELNWDFFFYAEKDKVAQFEEYWWAYYQLDADLVIAIVFFNVTLLILHFCFGLALISWWPWLMAITILAAIVFARDAWILREDIRRLIKGYQGAGKMKIPHEGVYTRLGQSEVHGIGVFSVKDIPKGTIIFKGDETELIWIDKKEINNAEPEIRKLYDDFCIIKGDRYGCPENFNSLTVGWYINESKDSPNVEFNAEYEDFIALRNIKQGEELLVDYSKYSDYPKNNK